jgi:uncharacterized membrane protein
MTDRRLRTVGLAVCVAGAAIAAYLTYVHYAGVAPVCAISHGCEKVQSSSYAKLVGVPVAVLGLIGYLLVGAALVRDGSRARVAAGVLAVAGCAFSAYLTYLELAVIHAICQWCVASAVLMTLLAAITAMRFIAGPLEDVSPIRRRADDPMAASHPATSTDAVGAREA